MLLPHYLGMLRESDRALGEAFRQVAEAHGDEVDVFHLAHKLALECDAHVARLDPVVTRYGEACDDDEPERLHRVLFDGPRTGPLALLRDLHDLYLLAAECDVAWTLVGQAARGLRDEELLAVVEACEGETAMHLKWLLGRMKVAAPQALVVA
jgi:hypothetical protein